jgi:hypothetical protein
VPNSRIPIRAPLCGTADVPPQQRVTRSTLPRNPPRLEFGKMGLEEADLMFSVDGRRIGGAVHDAEMIPDGSFVNCRCGLGNELGSTHGLTVPERGAVECKLGALGAACVCGILVGRRQVNVGSYGSGSVLLQSAFCCQSKKEDLRCSTGMGRLDWTKTRC